MTEKWNATSISNGKRLCIEIWAKHSGQTATLSDTNVRIVNVRLRLCHINEIIELPALFCTFAGIPNFSF